LSHGGEDGGSKRGVGGDGRRDGFSQEATRTQQALHPLLSFHRHHLPWFVEILSLTTQVELALDLVLTG